VTARGGHVHYARSAAEGSEIVVRICRQAGAARVTKGKSMVSEEMGLNRALAAADIETVETDLGEYIIQLADEPPSHIIAPAVHKTRPQITELFHHHHGRYGKTGRVTERADIVREAREVLRDHFVRADAGVTGANFLVAETGSVVLVTNEGNGDLTASLPRVHIVTAGIEKVIPTLEDLSVFLRLLARSATGQEMSVYTSLFTGAARAGDRGGPGEFHVVLVDNGRSSMLGNEFHEMLRCIRCGACLNHCPVYSSIGGHAYGWVYSGPMGSVLTPLMTGLDGARDLPNACTLNGRCAEICPVRIPLPDLLRRLRVRLYDRRQAGAATRMGLGAWAWFAQRPNFYQACTSLAVRLMARLGRRRGVLRRLPLASGWTTSRDFPIPQGDTFQRQWRRRGDR
jgi:L-lactate dehydrogenase complex protein LldF